jgi:hypothetical protein
MSKSKLLPHYAMGELTVAQDADGGWIVLEDGRCVGGTLRYPFETREDAQRWVDKSIREEANDSDASVGAMAKVIRETDPELWARCEQVEAELAGVGSEAERDAAHMAAGTLGLMIRLACASLEAKGEIYRSGTRDGRPVFRAWPPAD